ncbi:hypothetical protein LA080_002334 [Diaporthe eres]|nr:hypothetical protein LA080_002334 [Diaporthe eres]
MFGHFALGTQSRSQAPDDENGREDDSTTTMVTQPETQALHQRPWHTPNSAADDGFKSERKTKLRREGTASMDVLTHKFSNSHLRLDNTSTTEPDLTRHPHNSKQDVRRLRRKPSFRFLNEAEANNTIQTRVEGMISTGTQCNVYTPPLVPVVPIEADEDDGIDCEMGATGLEVDEGVGGDDDLRRWKFVTSSHSAHWIVWETQNDGNVMALGNLITRSCNLAAAAIFGLGVLEDMGTLF